MDLEKAYYLMNPPGTVRLPAPRIRSEVARTPATVSDAQTSTPEPNSEDRFLAEFAIYGTGIHRLAKPEAQS